MCTGIPLCIGHIYVALDFNVVIDLDLDAPNRRVNLGLDDPNDRFQYQKFTHHTVKLGSGELHAYKLVNLPSSCFTQTILEGVAGGLRS